MTYILTIKAIDSSEREIDMETSNKEEAIHIANQYTCGGEGIVEYAYLSRCTAQLDYSYSYSSCEWEEA